jgi:hypothetical protein
MNLTEAKVALAEKSLAWLGVGFVVCASPRMGVTAHSNTKNVVTRHIVASRFVMGVIL